ncbi:MAG: glycosyltransferase family 2 protein [Propionibacteriaceae bacterium]|nr:glycosyltransferase family 2 protein [Propionibacteriaceae bacterium]
MGKKTSLATRRVVPHRLGNEFCGLHPYVIALLIDVMMHLLIGLNVETSAYMIMRLTISFIFFIYPLYYVADVLWSMRPSVAAVLSGDAQINRKNYANTPRTDVPREKLLPVTVSIPIYTEDNKVVFETIRQALHAADHYHQVSNQEANVVVSDDGLAPFLGGVCDHDSVADLMESYLPQACDGSAGDQLSKTERLAAERIAFYRTMGVGFVARPAAGRPGKFKKASNLNYTLHLGHALEEESLAGLCAPGARFAGGYAEGDIRTHDIIMLLDKDSGLNSKIIEAAVPEFIADETLAYAQCATNVCNMSDNFYARAFGYHTNNLFHNTWPVKALQGYFVPLVGHNAFLRKTHLETSGWWAEDRVSEDYDKAIDFYNHGFHGKYLHFRGLEFSEYTSKTFAEEAGKQFRYSYGLLEMLLQGTVKIGTTRACDVFFMILYFCSLINAVMLLPMALLETHFGNLHLLWAGFLFCNMCFIFLPWIRSIYMRRRIPADERTHLGRTLVIALSFLGHAYSAFAGVCRFFTNLLRSTPKAFPATNVDDDQNTLWDGLKIVGEYFWKNKPYFIIAILCIERGMYVLTLKYVGLGTTISYTYILLVSVLVPFILTPQLYTPLVRALTRTKSTPGRTPPPALSDQVSEQYAEMEEAHPAGEEIRNLVG